MANDLTPRDLASLVLDKIRLLGDAKARDYFGVAHGTIIAWKTGKNLPSLAAAQKVWDESLICQTPEIWGHSGKAVLLMPIYEAMEPLTFVTLFRACRHYGMDKLTLIPRMRTLIVEARNDLAERALLTNAEWFIFPDSDCVLPCGSSALLKKYGLNLPEHKASRNAIERLMSHPPDKLIVGALYKDRRQGNRAQCETAFRSAEQNQRLLDIFSPSHPSAQAYDGLEETGWVGFGLVRVHRSVFERMKEAAKPGGLLEDIAPPEGREGEPYGYFHTTRKQRGEDVVFCRRAAQLGVTTFVDLGLTLGHVGKRIC